MRPPRRDVLSLTHVTVRTRELRVCPRRDVRRIPDRAVSEAVRQRRMILYYQS